MCASVLLLNLLQKADPTQFMQIHGRKCKIHLDPAVAAAGESPAVMQVIFTVFRLNFISFLPLESNLEMLI